MIVLDTAVISYIYNRDSRAVYYLARTRGLRAFIAFQTLEEMWKGAYARGWGNRRMGELERYLRQYEVVWPGPRLVDLCARLRVEREEAGRRLNTADAWIAATAVMLDCPLATHDRDFSGIPNLEVIQSP